MLKIAVLFFSLICKLVGRKEEEKHLIKKSINLFCLIEANYIHHNMLFQDVAQN